MVELETLPTQAFMHRRRPRMSHVRPVPSPDQVLEGLYHPFKPNGGIWTSTWEGCFERGWPAYLGPDHWHWSDDVWLLEPKESRVITIESYDHAKAFEDEFGFVPPWREPSGEFYIMFIDWAKVAQVADAVRLPDPYIDELRFGYSEVEGGIEMLRSTITWYGWDCESTWWAKWRFEGRPRHVSLASRRVEAE